MKRPSTIERVRPASTSYESPRQAQQRRRTSGRVIDPAARSRRRRRLAVTLLTVVAVILLGLGVAAYAYMRAIGNKINAVTNADPTLGGALTQTAAAAPGDPFYMVIMGSDTRPGETQQRSDTLIVARVDPKQKKIEMMSIARDSRVQIPGHGLDKINAAASIGGPALTIKTVSQLTGLPISHYINIDFAGFREIVDAMGGVWIDVPQDINDRQASAFGSAFSHIKKGYQKLDGRLALTFVRSRHAFAAGDFARMSNQQLFIKALAKQALALSNVFKAPSIVNAVANHMSTDLTPEQLVNLALQFKGMPSNGIQSATAPGTPKYINGISYVVLDDAGLAAMVSRMKQGQPLEAAGTGGSTTPTPTVTVKPSQVPLTIRNGAGVSGLAKQCADFFTAKGFHISDSGNMNQFVYGQTLIVYQSGKVDSANLVRDTLGFGNVIPSAGMYSFKTPVMVVIGKDWRNPATTSGR